MYIIAAIVPDVRVSIPAIDVIVVDADGRREVVVGGVAVEVAVALHRRERQAGVVVAARHVQGG